MKKIFFINVLVIILIIFILEIVVRTFNLAGLQGYDKNLFYIENGITLAKPNTELKIFGKYSKTDSNGFRIPLNNYFFDKNKKSTLILGDSVSFGVGVEEKYTFVGLLRGKGNNLLNASISGHNLESYLYLLKRYNDSDNIKFEKTVIILCLNDIVPFQGVISKNSNKKQAEKKNFFEKNINDNLATKINIFFRERSALFVFLKGLVTNPSKRHYDLMANLYDNEENIEILKSQLSKIDNYSNVSNIDVSFVLLPYAYQINNDCNENLMKPQKEINRIFKNIKLPIFDYSKKFCNETNKSKLFLPYDPVHLSLLGHKLVSKILINDKIF